jgi:hypothetical protein
MFLVWLSEGKEGRQGLAEATLRNRSLQMTLEEALREVLGSLNSVEMSNWLAHYVSRVDQQQRSQDKIGEVIADLTIQLFPDISQVMSTTTEVGSHFAAVRRRRLDAPKKISDFKLFADTWGQEWKATLTLGWLTMDVIISCCADSVGRVHI